jgi:penicillin-binding protein 1A
LPSRTFTRTYYTEALRDFLLNRSTILGDTYDERYRRLFRGGLRIHTTFNATLQARAEEARLQLPQNVQGFDAAIVSLDSGTGAIRAMVGGPGFVAGDDELNMALEPRQTGSSVKFFILAAAVQAGAQPGDVIDGVRGCVLPNPGNEREPFVIDGGIAGSVTDLQRQTALSVNCAFARLSQIVGLNRVVDTTYRMAQSPYLYPGQPASDRAPIEPFASYATGANEMSPLDMASGMQTLANEGLHKQPYYVEFIDDAAGERVYTHVDPGSQVLERGAALQTVDILKSVLTGGTARRYPLEAGRPAFGKTGTQEDNTNAWFVGATRQLTTAVWVGDPNAYTEMDDVPEFVADGVDRVQGGTYPARIWKTYMDPAHAFVPLEDWAAPPPPARPNGRLYLPGNECRLVAVAAPPPVVDPNAPPTTPPADPALTTTTLPPPPVFRAEQVGDTIPPDIVDPLYPLTLLPLTDAVGSCRNAVPAGSIATTVPG